MKAHQRKQIHTPPSFRSNNTVWQPNALQRAIENGPKMQAQHRHVNLLAQQAVLQRNSFEKLKNWFRSKGEGERTPLLNNRNNINEDIESGHQRIERAENGYNVMHLVENGITSHSPGIYTGPLGVLNPASQVINFSQLPHSVTTAPVMSTNMGFALSGMGGLGDLVGGGLAIKTIAENVKASVSADSDYLDKRAARSAVKTAVADLGSQVIDAGSQTASIIGSTSLSGASTAAQVAPFLSIPVNLAVGVRATRSAWRARKYEAAFSTIADDENSFSQVEAKFAANQMRKRKWRQRVGAFGAALGTAGAVALGIGAVAAGAATLATPIGWGLVAGGAAVALGLGVHKAYRYIKKRNRGELGVERIEAATSIIDKLHSAASTEPQEANTFDFGTGFKKAHKKQRGAFLVARGIDPDELLKADKDKSVKYLAGKLKSW